MNAIQRATVQGTNDGQTEANEAIEGGWYGKASDWDSGLINAIGQTGVAKLFGVEADTDEYTECLKAYSDAAQTAWDAVGIEAGV